MILNWNSFYSHMTSFYYYFFIVSYTMSFSLFTFSLTIFFLLQLWNLLFHLVCLFSFHLYANACVIHKAIQVLYTMWQQYSVRLCALRFAACEFLTVFVKSTWVYVFLRVYTCVCVPVKDFLLRFLCEMY